MYLFVILQKWQVSGRRVLEGISFDFREYLKA
jgi:hypothetical protein